MGQPRSTAPLLRETDVRQAARPALWHVATAPDAVLVDEMVLGEHGRVDVALIDAPAMHAVELKSDRDTLTRLPRQIACYSSVFDYCTLAVTARHVSAARAQVPPEWGLATFTPTPDGTVRYQPLRPAQPHGQVRAQRLVQLLWREETLSALAERGAARGVRSKPRTVLWQRLCQLVSLEELRTIVRTTLRHRQGWRDTPAPEPTLRPERVSSRFLARRIHPPTTAAH